MTHTHHHGPAAPTSSDPTSEATLRDPVCGMVVEPTTAHRTTSDGEEVLFCSAGCLAKYTADPARYAADSRDHEAPAPPAEDSNSGRSIHTCPMHPDVQNEGPGSCPKCGMALEPLLPVRAKASQWTCPMHPEVVQDHPGSCPQCGMALEPMEPTGDEEVRRHKPVGGSE